MNQITVNQLSWAVVVLILLPLLGFVGIMVFRRVVRPWRVQTNPLSSAGAQTSTLREIGRCWLPPTVVMAVFVALSGEFGHELEQWLSLTSFARIPAVVEPGYSPVQTDNLADTDPKHDRPGWIDEGNSQSGEIQRIVMSSSLWATEAEASRELLPRVASIVRTDFSERHKGLFDQPGHRFLSDERLAHVAMKRQYLERIEQNHGSMVLPMCRLWQQIEISPMVRTEIYPAWKSAVLGSRVVIVGAVLSLMTLVASAASLFVKLKRLPNHSSIFAPVVAASCAGVWITGDLLLAMRLCS